MSNKTTFKRIALAVVAALGFGVLASGPSSAGYTGASFSIDAATDSVTKGDTATAVLTLSFTALDAGDSITVRPVLTTSYPTGGASAVAYLSHNLADSVNATIIPGTAIDSTSATSSPLGVGLTGDTAKTITAKFTAWMPTQGLPVGSYVFSIVPQNASGVTGTAPAAVSWTVTVADKNIKPVATLSKVALTGGDSTVAVSFAADSTIVVAKGTSAVARLSFDQRNSANETSVTGTRVYESVTAVITGSGLLSLNGGDTKLRAITTIVPTDTITVWGDNTAGIGTITLSTASMSTWTSKSVTFSGDAASAALTTGTTVISKVASDSQTAVRVSFKDSAGLVVPSAKMYVWSSDTKVISSDAVAQTLTIDAAKGYATVALTIGDTGTATLKLGNQPQGGTTAPTVVTNEVTVRVVGAAATISIKFDKTTYKPGEVAKIRVTAKDVNGNAVANQKIANLLKDGISVSPAGSTTISDTTVTLASATYAQGSYDFEYTMTTVASEVVAKATGGTGLSGTAGQIAVYDTVTVFNPAEDAANSALDAAQEATDAAIAATDAAILAQEAADEAAAAATAAQETAQAAVDAVTALSGQVTKLVAQLATLQKLINRIAKKVGVKR